MRLLPKLQVFKSFVCISASCTSTTSYVMSGSAKPLIEETTSSIKMLKHLEMEKKRLGKTEYFMVRTLEHRPLSYCILYV